jgi:hypothetical protein
MIDDYCILDVDWISECNRDLNNAFNKSSSYANAKRLLADVKSDLVAKADNVTWKRLVVESLHNEKLFGSALRWSAAVDEVEACFGQCLSVGCRNIIVESLLSRSFAAFSRSKGRTETARTALASTQQKLHEAAKSIEAELHAIESFLDGIT